MTCHSVSYSNIWYDIHVFSSYAILPAQCLKDFYRKQRENEQFNFRIFSYSK